MMQSIYFECLISRKIYFEHFPSAFQYAREFIIDGADIRAANWLRWMNCATTLKDENVQPRFCKDKLHYMTTRDIPPGEELLVFYGYKYAFNLGIDITPFFLRDTFPKRHKSLRVKKKYKEMVEQVIMSTRVVCPNKSQIQN